MFETSDWVQDKQWCRERFMYEPSHGVFLWNTRPISHFHTYRSWISWNSRNAGTKMGHKHNGYMYATIDGKRYTLHRLVFMWLSGYKIEDCFEVDHINGVRDDNRLVNLRVVDRSENQRNTKRSSNNTSSVTGVHKHNTGGWVANITHNRRRESKMFPHFDDAVLWRKKKEVEYGYHENHGRV